jgi:hypothetical protein
VKVCPKVLPLMVQDYPRHPMPRMFPPRNWNTLCMMLRRTISVFVRTFQQE